VHQRHEHFLLPSRNLVDIITYDGIAAGKPVFIAQPLQYPHRSMALFGMHLFVSFQNGIDDASESSQLWGNGFSLAPIARRHCILAHLLDSLAMNSKISRNFTLTSAFHHHRSSNLYI